MIKIAGNGLPNSLHKFKDIQ